MNKLLHAIVYLILVAAVAALVFEKSEAMTDCAFCGRTLVRSDYVSSREMPEMIIPFRITKEEAAGLLTEWCGDNRSRPEAAHLQHGIGELKGFYLPYELIRGPVAGKVSRMDSKRLYRCRGYVDNVFVSCSGQLDNLLLDGMEPFELDELAPFDFAYAAGQRIRIADVDTEQLSARVSEEISQDYTPAVQKTLETQAVDVYTDPSDVLRMPVLLPVYYLSAEGTMAAVNGQTGKVSVRADRESHYYFLPWWLKAILTTLIISGLVFAALRFFGMTSGQSLYVTGLLSVIYIIININGVQSNCTTFRIVQ